MKPWQRNTLDRWAKLLHFFAYILFNLLLIGGFAQVGSALFVLYFLGRQEGSVEAVNTALHGLELMFLAPLPATVMISVNRWLASVFWPDANATSAERAELMVTEMKVKVVHLMAAIAATETVNRAASSSGPRWETTICGLLIVAVLCAFGVVLKRKEH